MLGLVTIGQSPRDDITHSMFGTSTRDGWIEAGALDELAAPDVADLYPRPGEHPLVTRLRDGSETVVAKERLMPHLVEAILQLEEQGARMIAVLCTGTFPPLGSRSTVVYPDRILSQTMEAILPEGTLGVLMPHAGQHESMVRKWATPRRSVVTSAVSPYGGSSEIRHHAGLLARAAAQMIVMDCMGFDRGMLRDARAAATTPVMLANGLVGAVLKELVDLDAGDS